MARFPYSNSMAICRPGFICHVNVSKNRNYFPSWIPVNLLLVHMDSSNVICTHPKKLHLTSLKDGHPRKNESQNNHANSQYACADVHVRNKRGRRWKVHAINLLLSSLATCAACIG